MNATKIAGAPHQERLPSYYHSTLNDFTTYPSLEGDIETDVAIIGAGFTGIATAVELVERGYRVAVVESNRVGWGASGRNGGQVTGSLSGDAAMRQQMRATLGDEVDDFIWFLRWRGHDIIRQRIEKYGIDCDLRFGHLHTAMKPIHLQELEESFSEAQARGMSEEVSLLNADQVKSILATDLYCGAIRNNRNMHLHPLNLCMGEAKAASSLGAQIFEHTYVQDIEAGARPVVVTDKGRILAQHVLLAGDVYHRLAQKQLGGMIFPAMGGIVTTEPLGDLARQLNPECLAVYDCRFVLDYYRMTADGRLLFGGGCNYSGRDSRDIAAELRPAIETTFPQLKGIKIDHQWSCAMGIVVNRIPQLGQLSPNVWYCQGYSGHGVASSHIMGEIMADAIGGQLEKFDVFERCSHVRVPMGDWLGNPMLAAGMWYYRFKEAMR
ncbi:NAD(P)/FAD-dependent oxidoreductase [Nitrincola schmidtii]|uniref:NAD(P)/FAD-dependent oxidoreductase n=1 Tax=Nitrincola schmidtii TaxID=1730894 RepID=UPI00124C29DD|nr:FAD-binding oxidoreductase [Nitrincola schmidtii]